MAAEKNASIRGATTRRGFEAPGFADYLILGNSAAGVTAAERIRQADPNGSIVIASPEPHTAYGRPLISYLIEGKTSEERIGYKDAGFYKRVGATALLGPGFDAVSLDAAAHECAFSGGARIRYGKCLVATGSVPFTPPIEGLAGRANVCTFMTLNDARCACRLAAQARERAAAEGRESHAVVIGAGLIGLKAAEALSSKVDRITVLELAGHILPAVLDDEAAALLQCYLADHRIECRPGVSAQQVLGEGAQATGALLTDGSRIDCDFIVAAVGVRPNTGFVVEAGAEQGRGLVCGPDLQTSLPDVYAAGDVVQVRDALDGALRPLALWPNAVAQGRIAGAHMAGAADAPAFEESFAVNAVDFFDASLLTAGIINPSEDSGCEVRVQRDEEAGSYAKLVVRNGALAGYILLNRPERAGVLTSLIASGAPLSQLQGGLEALAEPCNLDFPVEERWTRLHCGYPAGLDRRGWKR